MSPLARSTDQSSASGSNYNSRGSSMSSNTQAPGSEPAACLAGMPTPPSLASTPRSATDAAAGDLSWCPTAPAALATQAEHSIPFPPRISSLMYPSPCPSTCGLASRVSSTPRQDATDPRLGRGSVGYDGGSVGKDANVAAAAAAGPRQHEDGCRGGDHGAPLPKKEQTGGTGQTLAGQTQVIPQVPQQARALLARAHTLSTSCLSGQESTPAAAGVSSVGLWSTRSEPAANAVSTRRPELPLMPTPPISSHHAPRTMSKSPPPPAVTTSSRCSTGTDTDTDQTLGIRISTASKLESKANATADHQRNPAPSLSPSPSTALPSPTLFHRAASFLTKFTGSSTGTGSSQGDSAPPSSVSNSKGSAAAASGMPMSVLPLPLRRRPSLPLSARISRSSDRGNATHDHVNAAIATSSPRPHSSSSPSSSSSSPSSSPTRVTHALAISQAHPLSAALIASRGTPISSPHLSIASAPPAISRPFLDSPPLHPGRTTTSMSGIDSPPLPLPLPPQASPRPASIRSVTSTASKRTPSIKVPAKKRFGWSRRFFRFKDREVIHHGDDSPHSSAYPPSTAFALDPIADEGGSGSFFTCAKHVVCSKTRLAEHASPTCCIASPRLVMKAALSAAAASSDLSTRPLLTAGPTLRPSTPVVDDTCPQTTPSSPTTSIRRPRPPLASPNPTSISRSTSLASTSSARRQPRLERVHAEDRHDPGALAHRFQLALSATASDILVRNYRKSPRALVVALYSATLVQDLGAAGNDTDSGHGDEEEAGGGTGAHAADGSQVTELVDGGVFPPSGPAFLRQFQDLLAHSVVPHQLLFPPGTVESPNSSTTMTPSSRHTAIIHADFGLVTPPVSPMTPPPPLGPIPSTPTSSSSAPLFSTTPNKPTKPTHNSSTDTYTLKVAHMLLTHHLAAACLSVIQSIDRPTLLSVLARPRDRVPKLVLHCPSVSTASPSPTPPHHRRSSTAASFRTPDRAALAVQSAIDLAARSLYARFVECARLRCPPRTKRRASSATLSSSTSLPPVPNPMSYLYTSVLRSVRLMAYVSAADRELRWTWAGRDARVRVPGMIAALDAGWDGLAERDAKVAFSVFPGLVLVTDSAYDPVVVPVLVPGDVRRGRAPKTPSASEADDDDDDDDNVPLWSLPVRPPSSASSTGSTATVHSSSVASRRGSRAPSVGVEGEDEDECTRGRVVVDEQVFVIPTTATDAVDGAVRMSPVVGVETARRRAPGARGFPDVGGWQGRAHQMGARPATMPVFPVAATEGLVCRTPSPALTHRLSFGSDTTVVIRDGSSDTDVSDTEGGDLADADGVGEWVDIGVPESFESSMSLVQPAGMAADETHSWMASPVRPSTATAVLREALALEWRDMFP